MLINFYFFADSLEWESNMMKIDISPHRSLSNRMIHAVERGNLQEVKEITEKHGLSHCPDWLDGCYLLRNALDYDRRDVARFLIEAGAKLSNTEKDISILHNAVALNAGRYFPIVTQLLRKGVSVNSRTKSGDTPLHCVKYVKSARVLLLAKPPPDVNATNNSGFTPLHMAAMYGNTRLIRLLLDEGAEVNKRASGSKEDHGVTPLHLAAKAYAKSGDVCAALLARGADINARNSAGETALHIVVLRRRVASCLVAALSARPDVDIDARDAQGNTALARVAARFYVVPLSTLLSYGADVNITNEAGLTPVQIVEDYREKYSSQPSFRRFPYDRVLRVSMTLRSHVAKLSCAGLPVSEDNLIACKCTKYVGEEMRAHEIRYATETLDDPDFVKRCTDEVVRMKSERIGNSCVSYYDILSRSIRQVATYSRNDSISQVMDHQDSTKKFAVYGLWIDVRYHRAKKRAQLQQRAVASLNAVIGFLPLICIDLIVDFLSIEDLKKCANGSPELDD